MCFFLCLNDFINDKLGNELVNLIFLLLNDRNLTRCIFVAVKLFYIESITSAINHFVNIITVTTQMLEEK